MIRERQFGRLLYPLPGYEYEAVILHLPRRCSLCSAYCGANAVCSCFIVPTPFIQSLDTSPLQLYVVITLYLVFTVYSDALLGCLVAFCILCPAISIVALLWVVLGAFYVCGLSYRAQSASTMPGKVSRLSSNLKKRQKKQDST